MKCNLYFVIFHYDDNYDMFVWARSRQEAVELWQTYWAPNFDIPFNPDNVFLVPTVPADPGVVDWESLRA